MQIRCSSCTRTVAIAETGELPARCPHCAGACAPSRCGPFVPLRLVATGGMGEVYLARHQELGTEVALKLLPAMPPESANAVRERFAREARLTAKVDHPGVVKVLGSDMAGDRPYLVLEFVSGQTLRQRLHAGPLPVVEAARLAAAIADVLAAAHAHGVLHRDVKPDNVMVTAAGEVRVLDFGIAKALGDDAPLTRTGEIVGTPEYMAPEQLLEGPEATDPRTDVHALGVLLYELLTGRSPFRGSNLFQALKLVESLVPPPPSQHRAQVPGPLDAVVAQALQKHRDGRFPTASRFAAAVRQAVPEAVPRTPPAARWPRQALLLAAVLVLGAVGLGLLLRGDGGRQTTGQDDGTGRTVEPSPEQEAAEAARQLAEGQWFLGLARAQRAAGGAPGGKRLVADAFLLAHWAWPLAADLPPWFAATAERQRQHLFGDSREPIEGTVSPTVFAAATAGEARACLLRDLGQPNLVAAELLAIPALDAAAQADALASYAQRLPLDGPEHWLARLLERRRRGDLPGCTQAAELAWLHGAGELAVLLDAALQFVATDPGGPRLQPLPPPRAALLRRRVGAADPRDSPASHLLVLLLDASQLAAGELDLGPARRFPAPMRSGAAAWCVAAATAGTGHQPGLLLASCALGAKPDYAAVPWSAVPATERARLDQEVHRGQ